MWTIFSRLLASTILLVIASTTLEAETDRYRATWREDPATTMVIGWDQISGNNPVMYFDAFDHGWDYTNYTFSKKPDHIVQAKSMNNHFVRLTNLRPNTVYYFVVVDSEGVGKRYSFKTAPADPQARLSIIAGGDSRNNREARQDANRMVSKIRPTIIMFSGDMTDRDTNSEWVEWLNDWQLTIGTDGRIFPVLVARGNHEASDQTLFDLFDLKNTENYFALSFAGDLLRLYSLNSMIPVGGNQASWLERDLKANTDKTWRIAQYHHPIRPHTSRKKPRNDQYANWASLFYDYRVQMVVECDAHVVKTTWPVRPSNEPGSVDGFIRDDARGTVFVGEGCWGAPLRTNDIDRPWTRNSGSFNQFKWVWVNQEKVEIRTVMTDGSDRVAEVRDDNQFVVPLGMRLWNPSNGDLVTITRFGSFDPFIQGEDQLLAARDPYDKVAVKEFSSILNKTGQTALRWTVEGEPLGLWFEVQRAEKGGAFSTIAEVKGTGRDAYVYECIDQDGRTDCAYRLVKKLPGGRSKIYLPEYVAPSPPMPNDWDQFPQLGLEEEKPVVRIGFALLELSDVLLEVVNQNGQIVSQNHFPDQGAGKHLKQVDFGLLPPGRYLIHVITSEGVLRSFRVVNR